MNWAIHTVALALLALPILSGTATSPDNSSPASSEITSNQVPTSAEQHKQLAATLFAAGKTEEAEKEFRTAARLKTDDPDCLARWGYALLVLNRMNEALTAITNSLALSPSTHNAAWLRTKVAYIYSHQDKRLEALRELDEAVRIVSPEDLETEGELWKAFAYLRQVPQEVEHGEKFISLAKQQGTMSDMVQAVEQSLGYSKPRLVPHYITNEPPREYTTAQLRAEFQQRLTPAEMKLVVSPLECSSDMEAWARELVAGATNDLQKAKALFQTMLLRIGEDANDHPDRHYTAREVFADWKKQDVRMHCQQMAYLNAALARAVGLKAWVVEVDETCDGIKTQHGCSVIYLDGKGTLVDPGFTWFGVPHKQFQVLDDLQATAIYLCQAKPTRENDLAEIAVKLGPDLPLVQFNLLNRLINLGRWEDARKHLPAAIKTDAIGALANSTQVRFAMHDGNPDQAVRFAQLAITIDPLNANHRLILGDALVVQGKFSEAREAYQVTLKCPHSPKQEADVAAALSGLAALEEKQKELSPGQKLKVVSP